MHTFCIKLKLFSIFLSVSLLFSQSTAWESVGATKSGSLVGIEFVTSGNRSVHSFLGVPYAKPPVGELRFKEPEPFGRWKGKWLATESGSKCLQLTPSRKPRGTEDCLYLDIYTPYLTKNPLLPVLVYFHGGEFKAGTGSSLKPYFLMDTEDFVYVSVNYRLGSIGFLSTEDDVVPGNNGLKDQVMALRWVQENIGYFGGNKAEVTIAGQSSGGASVHLHFMSPLSRGLFKRGISMSGSALNPWALSKRPLQKAEGLAAALGCPTHTVERMVQCMKQQPATMLVSFDHLFQPWRSSPVTIFGPVVEKSSKGFLGEHPYKVMVEGRAFDGPWMASVTSEDGLPLALNYVDLQERLKELDQDWLRIAPHLLDYNFTATWDRDNVSSLIRSAYLDKEGFSERNVSRLTEMLTDRMLKVDVSKAAKLQAATLTSDVFLYVFSYRGLKHATKPDLGVRHGEDLNYIFGLDWNTGSIGPPFESKGDRAMASVMQRVWINFVKTGDPTGFGEEKLLWTPQPKDPNSPLNYLLINNAPSFTMTSETNFGNMKFWSSLEFLENENYIDSVAYSDLRNGSTKMTLISISIIGNLLVHFACVIGSR